AKCSPATVKRDLFDSVSELTAKVHRAQASARGVKQAPPVLEAWLLEAWAVRAVARHDHHGRAASPALLLRDRAPAAPRARHRTPRATRCSARRETPACEVGPAGTSRSQYPDRRTIERPTSCS